MLTGHHQIFKKGTTNISHKETLHYNSIEKRPHLDATQKSKEKNQVDDAPRRGDLEK